MFKGQPPRMDEAPSSPYESSPAHSNALGVMGVPPSNDLPSIGTFDSTQFRYDGSKDRLVKQTYSVFVETQEGRRKWHLGAFPVGANVLHSQHGRCSRVLLPRDRRSSGDRR